MCSPVRLRDPTCAVLTCFAEVRTEILQLAKEAADIKSITITIPAQYHGNIIGQNGTTLNAVIGEDRLVNVSFGNKTKSAETGEDTVVIRGPSEEVARVKAQIERIAEEARDTAIINAYVSVHSRAESD